MHQIVANVEFMFGYFALFEPQQIGCHQCRCTEHGISKHIDNNVRSKPRTLQRRHQRFVVYLRIHQVDGGEHPCQQRTESEYPGIAPTRINNQACCGKKERIPQTRFAHGAERRTLKREPHAENESKIDEKSRNGKQISGNGTLLPSRPRTTQPQQQGGKCKIYKGIPSHNKRILRKERPNAGYKRARNTFNRNTFFTNALETLLTQTI